MKFTEHVSHFWQALRGFPLKTWATLVGLVLLTYSCISIPLLAIPSSIAYGAVLTRALKRRIPIAGFALTSLTLLLCSLAVLAFYVCTAIVLPSSSVVTLAIWSHINVIACAVVALVFGTWFVIRNRAKEEKNAALSIAISAVAFVCALVAPILFMCNRNESVVALQTRHDIVPELTPLYNTVQDRLLPQATAETYVQNLNAASNTSVEAPHLQLHSDGKLLWQSALQQGDRIGRLLQSVSGVIAVDAGHTDQQGAPIPNSSFVFGDQSWLFRGLFAARHPFSEIGAVHYYQNADKSWSILVSCVSKKPSLSLPAIGTMVPYYSGVMEVTQDGRVRDHSAKDAAAKFPGAVLYPPQLFRKQAEAYARWHGGFTGTQVLQNDALEVSEDASEDARLNPLPYVQHIEGLGLQYVMPLEPAGDKQWALVEVLLCDVASGKVRRMECPKGLIGPRQARLAVRSSDTRIDWSHIRKVEPRLVVSPRGVFWLIAIVSHWESEPDRHPYITSVLVDAERSSECWTFERADALREFLAQPRPQP
jgi:hypothetical protein